MDFFEPHKRNNHSHLNNSISKRSFLYSLYWCKLMRKKPIIITPSLTMTWGQVEHNNWGDDINVFFLKQISKAPVLYTPLRTGWADNFEVYIVIGSVIQWIHNPHTIIWGSGLIDDESTPEIIPNKILAVRGPLTRKRLLSMGLACPEVYGDPALLLPYYYRPKIKKRFKLGIIPHVSDYYKKTLDKYRNIPNVSIIRLFDYGKWTDVIDAILECDFVVSSSLHGLIVAEGYGIPNAWVEINNPIANNISNRFKFHDFFLSQGFDIDEPYVITKTSTLDDLMNLSFMYNKRQREYSILPLIEACPFAIKKSLIPFS